MTTTTTPIIDLSSCIDLSSRFLKVAVPVSMVGNSKKIDEVAAEIELSAGAQVGKAVKASKTLFSPDYLKPISTARNAIATKHRSLTSVWNDSSWRLLSSAKWFDYAAELNPLTDQFNRLADDLANRFDELVAEASCRLGTLFDRSQYPADAQAFRAKFKAEVQQEPLPTIEDTSRISLPMSEVESMKRSMERAYRDNIIRVQAENFGKLYEVAIALRDSLDRWARGEQKSVHSTLIDQVSRACDFCGEFNLNGDSHLAGLIADMRNSLTKYSMDEIRESPEKRIETVIAAQELATKAADRRSRMAAMSGYMN